MAAQPAPVAVIPGHVDASNGVERILSFWIGDWAFDPSKMAETSDEVKMEKKAIWFGKNDQLDDAIREAFAPLIEQGKAGKLAAWEDTPGGAAALVILLDQFPRNIFRGSPLSFSADPMALQVAERCIEKGFDKKLPGPLRNFIYLPFMHSEDLATSSRCIKLYEEELKDCSEGPVKEYTASTLHYAKMHTDIVRKFGHFPHRNAVLGRQSTAKELDYLAAGGGFA